MRWPLWAVLLLAPRVMSAQDQGPPAKFSDPVALLGAVAKNYAAAADTFDIESIAESTQINEYERNWSRMYERATKGPGNLYRIEARTPYGSFIQDSDGTNEWIWLKESGVYVKRPVPQNWPGFPQLPLPGEVELSDAWHLRTWLEARVAGYVRATMLPQQTIRIEGRRYRCYVVHVRSADKSEKREQAAESDVTFWIDEKELVIRKQVEHLDSYVLSSPKIRIPFHEDTTTVYPVVDFHADRKAEAFQFSPPPGAEEIATLEPNFRNPVPLKPETSLVGQQAPDVTLIAADGHTTALRSLQGKPVLLDLWATWCGPCLMSMPALARIARDVRDSGVAVVTVDQDSNADDATSYLARHGYGWVNYHDPDGKVMKALQDTGIPLTVLIDAQGKIVYYDFGGDEAAVRKAIAGLGPEYASVAQGAK
jgi:thiol-disulfide isomerase/thioredoxin